MTRFATFSWVSISVVCAVAAVATQNKPDFSGTWVLVTPADSAGQKLTITQTAETVKLVYTSRRGEETATYKLDGTPTRRTVHHVQDTFAQVISRASWKDVTLVVEETMLVDNHPQRSKLLLSLDASGALVLVDDRPWYGPEDFPEAPRRLVFAKQ